MVGFLKATQIAVSQIVSEEHNDIGRAISGKRRNVPEFHNEDRDKQNVFHERCALLYVV